MVYWRWLMKRKLNSVEQVIEALDGLSRVSLLTGRPVQAVWNWKARGKLPSDTYLILTKALEIRGYRAVDSLWGMMT